MSWEDTIKKKEILKDERLDHHPFAWMEEEAANSHNPERHMNNAIKSILGDHFGNGLVGDLQQRLFDEDYGDHVTYKEIDIKTLRKALLPVIEKLVKDSFEFDMSKFRYSGP